MRFNLMRLNIWRKLILVAFILAMGVMFFVDTGFHFNVGHVVRLFVGGFVFWVLVDRL